VQNCKPTNCSPHSPASSEQNSAQNIVEKIDGIERALAATLAEVRALRETPPALAVSAKMVTEMLGLNVNNGNVHRVKKLLNEYNVPKVVIPGMSTRYDVNDIRALISRLKRRLER